MFKTLKVYLSIELNKNMRTKNGAAALIVLIVALAITAVMVSGFSFLANREIAVVRQAEDSNRVLQAAESGIEEVITRLRAGGTPPSPLTLPVGSAMATVTVTAAGSQRTITSVGTMGNITRTIQVVVDLNVTESDFIYGIQVGDGGLTMANLARVNGSVYSDGDILGGNNGSRITGDAFVAVGTPPAANQSWTTQNADFSVGTSTGSIVTLVDSSGDIGEYTSIALGADGFARISYYDTSSNKDLKFVRCTNMDCTAKNIATLDSSGDVGYRYTSIAIGSDGFARISYYDNTNDDLKFIRCTNADCTTKNTVIVDTSDGQYSSMVLGSDDFARIAYYDGDLNFARCLDIDCTTKNITEPDDVGDTGQYTSIVLGSDGFARISYIDTSNDDLKFAHCLNDDCTSKNISTVDSSGDLGRNTSIALGADGFARISYMKDDTEDLKFVRCTDADCSTKNIATVDTSEGAYSSLELGSDGFGRISFYNGSDLAFVRCTNDDCTTKTITTPDTAGDTGLYTSLIFGADGFGRISYYDSTNRDLKFLRCLDAPCSTPDYQVDVAQSFQPTITDRVVSAEIYIKKTGTPANATLRLIEDSGGSPSTNAGDVLTTSTINASQVTGSYGWLTISFSSTPTLTVNTTYWLVVDTVLDTANYFIWGGDSLSGYARGTGKKSQDYTVGAWSDIGGDLDFKLYMGGADHKIDSMNVDGNANGHTVEDSAVGGNVNAFTFTNSTAGGNVNADSITDCTIGGNASYNTKDTCTIGGTETTPTTSPDDPSNIALPISDASIAQWKVDAASGANCVQPICDASGNLTLDNGQTLTIGPKKITGNLTLQNSSKLTLTGTIWVVGNIVFSNGDPNDYMVRLDAGYGASSGMIVTDGTVAVNNNVIFQGSGTPGSYVMVLSAKDAISEEVISIDNNSVGVIYYAGRGRMGFANNAKALEATAYGIDLDPGATIDYQSGLANAQFSSGPSAGWSILSWKEL